LLDIERTRLTLRATEIDVVEPVAVHITHGERGPLGGDHPRHEPLAVEVRELVLVVDPRDARQVGHVLEKP
jgi:hypothetical protein